MISKNFSELLFALSIIPFINVLKLSDNFNLPILEPAFSKFNPIAYSNEVNVSTKFGISFHDLPLAPLMPVYPRLLLTTKALPSVVYKISPAIGFF